MKRICVMGNSHVAALKGGWEQAGAVTESVSIDFFGALSKGMATLDVIEGHIGPRDAKAAQFFKEISGTGAFVDPDAYDAFVLVGMGLYPHVPINNYAEFATPSTRNFKSASHYVSDGCIADALWSEIERSMMMHAARTVRRVTQAPIWLVWQAHLSEDLEQIEWRRERFAPIFANGDEAFVTAMMADANARLADEGFGVLPQPLDTLATPITTRAEFSRGSVLFRKELIHEHRELDVFHMNAAYGARCWQEWEPARLAA